MIMIASIALALVGVWFIYATVATVFIRLCAIGIRKTIKQEHGVLLTFDDGPHPEHTLQLLALLAKYDVRAVFFVLGELVDAHPDIVKQMHAEGHIIGIHHYKHRSNWWLLPNQAKKQIEETKRSIEKVIGQEVELYRPPWGHFNLASLTIARQLKIIMWSHIYQDWKSNNHHLKRLLSHPPKQGSIILLHDNGDTKGADELAPLEMMRYLQMYLKQMKESNQTFVEPSVILGKQKGSYK